METVQKTTSLYQKSYNAVNNGEFYGYNIVILGFFTLSYDKNQYFLHQIEFMKCKKAKF